MDNELKQQAILKILRKLARLSGVYYEDLVPTIKKVLEEAYELGIKETEERAGGAY
jgi:hypothetical protein